MSVTGIEEEEDEGDGIGRVEVEATGGGTGTYVLPPSLPVDLSGLTGLWPQTLSEEGLMQGERAQDA